MKKIFLLFFKSISFSTFAISLFLLIINFTGLIIPDKRVKRLIDRPGDNLLSYRESSSKLNKYFKKLKSNEISDVNFFYKVNRIVNLRMINPNLSKFGNDKIFRPRLTENWILAILEKFDDLYTNYEYLYYKPALQRVIGLSSQQAYALVSILNKNGFEAGYFGGNEHVSAWAKTKSGKLYFLDPDYGVVLSADEEPDNIFEKYYLQALLDLGFSGEMDKLQETIYTHYSISSEKLKTFKDKKQSGILKSQFKNKFDLELKMFKLKWQIPITFLVISSILLLFIKRIPSEKN